MRYLKNAEYNPIFMPILGSIAKTLLPLNNIDNERINKIIQDTIDSIRANNSLMRNNVSIYDHLKSLNFDGELTGDEIAEMEELLNDSQATLRNENSKFKSKILELLDEK